MNKVILNIMTIGLLFGQVDYGADVQTVIDANCTNSGCHTNGGDYQNGLDLSSYDNLMTGDSSNGPVIIPFDHANSYLWQRVENGSMPPGNNPDLSSAEVDIIANWIDEGALQNPAVDVAGLFFSEYGEGSSNNKYLEIYNGTGSAVDLTGLAFPNVSNAPSTPGEYEYWNEFPAGATVDAGDVYVIANPAADDIILAFADYEFQYLSNGDDGFCLVEGTESSFTVIDCIGDWNGDPGDGWDVAGIVEATKNHTLVRKATIIEGNGGDWASSAGTDEGNSEWVVLDQDTWDYIGSHPHEFAAPAPNLVINEFLASNDLCCTDENGEYDDFIEIFNNGTEAIDIGGMYITDDLTSTTEWQIPNTAPDSTTIQPGGFLLLWADKESEQGVLHVEIKLSGGGEQIGLFTSDGNVIDSLTFGEQTGDISFGRYPDGAENWAFLSTPTPGSANEMEQSSITTIHDIQYVADPSTDDASPLVDQEVTISGIVTAEFWNGSDNRYLFVQDAPGPWNGIVCFNYDGWDTFSFQTPMGDVNSIAEGDSVTLTGVVTEYYGLTELTDISSAMIHGPAIAPFGPDQVTALQIGTGGTDAEAFESCLIAVEGVTITEPDEGYGEWTISDGTGSVRVDDKWDYFFWPEADANLAKVVGVLDYNYSNTKIQPRLARDVVEAVGEPARIQRVQQVLFSDLLNTGEDEVSDISYYEGETVTLKGIVTMPTGLSYAGSGIKFIYEDVHGGPWSAILSYDPDSTAFPILFEGDLVHATGYIAEYSTGPANMTELFITEPVDLVDFEQEMPPIDTVETGDLRWPTEAEQWGNVMVKVVDGIVSGNEYQYELFSVNDGSGDVLVDDDSDSIGVFFDNNPVPPVGSFVQSLRGWVYHHYGSYADSSAYKLEPLYIGDLEFGAGPPAINEPTREPCAPTSSDGSVTVMCEIEDNSSVASAEIMYSVNGGTYQSVSMAPGDGFEWTGDIPVSDGDDVNYYIVATDDGADQSEPKSSTFPYDNENGQLGFVVTDNLTIADVQFTSWPSGISRYHNCEVSVTGIVTGDTAQYNSGYSSYAFQDGSGPWTGVLFDGEALDVLSLGDEVQVYGLVTDFDPEWHFKFDGNTRIVGSDVEVLSAGNAVPAPALVSCEELSQMGEEVESYEGTLVQLNNVTVSSVNSYDWSITDDSGFECLLDDDMASIGAHNFMSTIAEGQVFESISGIFNFSFGTYKVQIRNMADLGQSAGINDDVNLNPYSYALYENFPNPFNPETQIRFELAATQDVRLVIYDILGRRVRFLTNESFNPGFHVVNWDGRNDMGERVASGVYVYRIKAGDFISHRKMLMVQ